MSAISGPGVGGAGRALLVLLLAAVAACAPAAPPPVDTSPAAPRGPLAWEPCAGEGWPTGARCADLRVPLDHAHPDGPPITVRVSWVPAADQAHRRGMLLANPGGPGASGLRNAALAARPSPAVAQALAGYDLVGFDPRGVGESSPVSCGLSDEQTLAVKAPTPSREGPERDAALAASAAAACARTRGRVLAHMGTADVAADMDLLRRALGVATFSYYGSSYGTYLGVVYDTLYPGRLDRVVLDSLVDSEHGWYDQSRRIAAATETRFRDFASWTASKSPGPTSDAVRGQVLAELAERQRAPLILPGITVDGALLRRATYVLVGRNRFDQLARLLHCAGQPPGDPCQPAMAAALRQVEGGDQGGGPTDDTGDQAVSAYLAVTCADSPWPRDPAAYARATVEDAARYPVTAGGFAQISPCASWPVPARPAVTASPRPGPPQILMLNNTHDRISALDGARSTRRVLGARARLVTVAGWNHQILGNHDPCADTLVADWLGGGRLPPMDTTCG